MDVAVKDGFPDLAAMGVLSDLALRLLSGSFLLFSGGWGPATEPP